MNTGTYAHIPGSGPAGATCRYCRHARPAQKRKFLCGKYQEMTTRAPTPIDGDTAACKYFEGRK